MPANDNFTFEISLSVLNHLGRNLYRSFTTVLGEAISNSWDADAENVWVYVNADENGFFIKDDGTGMTAEDFQSKFLKIGYSKRVDGTNRSNKGRPFIGRKGIGKLALLSGAERVSIISKTGGNTNYVGGVVDNSELDQAIVDDLTPREYPLEDWSLHTFADHIEDHEHGTIIYFEDIKDGIKNSIEFLEKIIALYFRFTLHDDSFSIYLNDKKIDYRSLEQLSSKTEFLWTINEYTDPYVNALKSRFTPEDNEQRDLALDGEVIGFIASVEKPRNLAIMTMGERVGIDIFVNGRLRERNLLQHIPTSRLTENYLYGQVHYDGLDDDVDRFTTSREGILSDDPKYRSFLERIQKDVISKVLDDWDEWRIKHRKPGDSENEKLSRKERSSRDLYSAVSGEFDLPRASSNRRKVNDWVDELADDARYNFSSYAECFVSENLVRRYIVDKQIEFSPETIEKAQNYRRNEERNKNLGNISIEIRQNDDDAAYLEMDELAKSVDNVDNRDLILDASLLREANLLRDATEYKPFRNAVAHTARLTEIAKNRLTTVYENIKGRIKTILSSD